MLSHILPIISDITLYCFVDTEMSTGSRFNCKSEIKSKCERVVLNKGAQLATVT